MSKQITRQASKHDRRRERREEQRRLEEARKKQAIRNRFLIWGSVIATVLVIAGLVVYFNVSGRQTATANNALPAPFNPAYPNVDNAVACDQQEQNDLHVHAHLTIYINGQNYALPANLGIAADGSCFYWLHVHSGTGNAGIIHIEAPAGHHDFTLGNFFDVWSQQFSQLGYPNQLDLTTGWTVYVNGQLYKGDFHKLHLHAHDLITMGYNSANIKPDTTYSWGNL